MTTEPRIRFFPCGNGDAILIETGDQTILTDINYRAACIDEDSDLYDIVPDIRNACKKLDGANRLNIFVLTHPDKDHLSGFTKLFRLGSPKATQAYAEDGHPLIQINEIWASPYALDPAYQTEVSEPILAEIKRRHRLSGTDLGQQDGNRLKILSTAELSNGQVDSQIHWQILGPTPDEANIKAPEEKDAEILSSNDSSLVLRWTLTGANSSVTVLLGGDATVNVWERIWYEHQNDPSQIGYDILLAPHHCSRGSIARKDLENDTYVYSETALLALGQTHEEGYVVASSKKIKPDDDNPPSWDAKQKYLSILEEAQVADAEDHFLNPEIHDRGKPAPVEFVLTSAGLTLKVPKKLSSSSITTSAAFGAHSSYGLS